MSAGTHRGADEIGRAIAAARERGRPALAPFVTAGFPSPEAFPALLESVSAESDLIEIGVPFSDPMADGVTIQRASREALEAGVNLPWILDRLQGARVLAPRILMSYLNPLLAFGIEPLARRAQAAGVSGLIVPDLPWEECRPYRRTLDAAGVALVQLVTPVTPPERLALLCRESRGFVYAVAMTGTTGGSVASREDLRTYLERVRGCCPLPVLVGFGIRTADQLREVADHADGAIVGSALIEVVQRGEDPVRFLRDLRATGGGS